MSKQRVVIVGAGMGGLTSALRLSHHGYEVTVLEASSVPGGKVHTREVLGAKIDSGPTVFTMRWVFDELFQEVGTSLRHVLGVLNGVILRRPRQRSYWTRCTLGRDTRHFAQHLFFGPACTTIPRRLE